jgi:hypothetical protein
MAAAAIKTSSKRVSQVSRSLSLFWGAGALAFIVSLASEYISPLNIQYSSIPSSFFSQVIIKQAIKPQKTRDTYGEEAGETKRIFG